MPGTSIIFRQRLEEAFQASSFKSYRQASLAADMSEPQVQQIIKGRFDHSKNGPGLFAMKRLAQALGTTLSHLIEEGEVEAPEDPAIFNGTGDTDRPTIDEMMIRHVRGGGHIDAFKGAIEYSDIYRHPDKSETPQIFRIGCKSLLGLRMGTTDRAEVQSEIDHMDIARQKDIKAFHQRVAKNGVALDSVFIDHKLRTRPLHVRAEYSRLGLLVVDQKGCEKILIHCTPIPV